MAVRLFLAVVCLAPSTTTTADAAFQLPRTNILRRQEQNREKAQQPRLLQLNLKETTDWSFFDDLFKFGDSDSTKGDDNTQKDGDPKVFFAEDTGRTLPNWTPPPPPPKPEPPKEAPPVVEMEIVKEVEKVAPPPPKITLPSVPKLSLPEKPILTKETTEELSKSAKVVVEKVVVSLNYLCVAIGVQIIILLPCIW